jgi:hypothetical protein
MHDVVLTAGKRYIYIYFNRAASNDIMGCIIIPSKKQQPRTIIFLAVTHAIGLHKRLKTKLDNFPLQ